jgi:hypothetical protein
MTELQRVFKASDFPDYLKIWIAEPIKGTNNVQALICDESRSYEEGELYEVIIEDALDNGWEKKYKGKVITR